MRQENAACRGGQSYYQKESGWSVSHLALAGSVGHWIGSCRHLTSARSAGGKEDDRGVRTVLGERENTARSAVSFAIISQKEWVRAFSLRTSPCARRSRRGGEGGGEKHSIQKVVGTSSSATSRHCLIKNERVWSAPILVPKKKKRTGGCPTKLIEKGSQPQRWISPPLSPQQKRAARYRVSSAQVEKERGGRVELSGRRGPRVCRTIIRRAQKKG